MTLSKTTARVPASPSKTAKKLSATTVKKVPAKRAAASGRGRGDAGAKVATPKRSAAKADVAHRHPPVAYRLHALLHTMHSIEHHEDQLCTLLTAIERECEVSPALRRELVALLEELPGRAFAADLEAARKALAGEGGTASKRKSA